MSTPHAPRPTPHAPLFVLGYPGPIGGACTELWHVLKLWRRYGLDVSLIPTWGQPRGDWKKRCDAIGCTTHTANPNAEELRAIEGLAGGTVISFCNEFFLRDAPLFRDLGCRTIWVNCMNWLFEAEQRLYGLFGPFDAYVCQSRYQMDQLAPKLAKWGVSRDRVHHIPGFLDVDEFTFSPRPHGPGEEFVVGRLSRAAPDKFSTNTWAILGGVKYAKRYRIMGWDPKACPKAIGAAPGWAETLEANAEPAEKFLASLHCYCQINGTATENWPRVGLEAMAAGVPIVVEARGGWPEMIEHRRTGFLGNSDAELTHWVEHLAYDEDCRLEIAERAYLRLIKNLTDPDDLWSRWSRLLSSLER